MSGENNPVYIPREIIDIILLKLPAKSLLRFKSVSKSWHSTISDPAFVRDHLHQSKSYSEENHLFISQLNRRECSLVKFEDGKFQVVRQLRNPNGLNSVLCYCDGVILLTDYSNSNYALWNPSTQANTPIYCSYFKRRFDDMSYGICYDPTSDDFKVVGVTFGRDYAVYSCKNKTWTKKKYESDGIGHVVRFSGLYVDGVIYWVMLENLVPEIVYFDPSDDEMKILQKPDNARDDNPMFLTCLMGRLCVYFNEDDETVVRIMIRDNSCWKELMTIENVETDVSSFEVMFFAENKVVIHWENSRLVVYDPSEKKFEDGDETVVFGSDFGPYVDTLFFPAQNNRFKRKR